jgi:uncharacterized caspase-like protein
MRRIGWIVFVLFAMLSTPSAGLAQNRVALVIGNGAYTKVPRLDNPKNDAAAMEAMFKAAGFNAVVRVSDLGAMAMRRALREFSDTARDADVAVVFYAGHGIEVGGVNYLIPVDAVLERDIDAPDEAISLDRINQVLEPVKHLRLVILDACRDNPFARSMRRTITTRSVRSGYGEIDERSLPPNTLVAYAQRAGFTAEDGVGTSNSPFTTALVKHLPTPGLDVELALRRVRDEVLRATKNRQEPFKYGSLSGVELPLVSGSTGSTAAATTKQVDVSGAKLSESAEAWSVVKGSANTAVVEAYIARFKDTFYAELARARLDELKKQAAAADTPKAEAGPESQSIIVGNYTVDKRSNITGQVLGKRQLASVDASKPDAAIQSCASACDAASQCQGFDFSIVYGNCTLYSTIEKKEPLAGYISGTRLKQQVALATPAKPVEAVDATRSGSAFRDCPECPEMVVVPAGEFMMGSPEGEQSRNKDESPQHKVMIGKPFAVGKFEVTFAEWDACVAAGGCTHRPDDTWGRGKRPVIRVSWDDITKEYLPWLSQDRQGLPAADGSGMGIRGARRD